MNGFGVVLVLLASASSLAASRARYGGTLHIAYAGKPAETEPLYADTPAEAALVSLVSRSLCSPFVSLSRLSPNVLHVDAKAAAALERARSEPTPYRALLSSIGTLTASGSGVDLELKHPWPDLERALCHPALAVPAEGPFRLGAGSGRYLADAAFPTGRPYLDELVVTSSDERGAERAFAQRRAQLALGLPPKDSAAATLPFATFLVLEPKLAAAFRPAFDSSVERADLTRFFVRAPAAPFGESKKPTSKPAPLNPPREVTLLFDASLDDQRAVAARLQVRLHPLGYKVALKPLPRRELRAHWAKGDYELMLFAVLLPPQPANALAVTLELAHANELTAKQLPALGAISDDANRDERAKELMQSLLPQLDAIPLYVQGLSVQATPQVQGLKLDAYGLPRLDDVFLGTE
jgi:MarR-like DNA-binding transcriptional regulator SgrR of sgrS sRNA